MQRINMPSGAKTIIERLLTAGFEAYIVGGCVRDSILGLPPHDWDICTSANPIEIEKVFSDRKTILLNAGYGTVSVIMDDDCYEVTTFRLDGEYSDSRHPDDVEFTHSLLKDLARRDFTINAMAYNDDIGFVDPYSGITDLMQGQIVCVGDPFERFNEDALRIMRALRFASTYGFSVEKNTAKAIHSMAATLGLVSAERKRDELMKLLVGKGAVNILMEYRDVMTTVVPELKPCVGFAQNNPWHCYTVYDHIAHAVGSYQGDDSIVKLALLLHDVGKPCCYTEDERGGHFHGHPTISYELSKRVVKDLRLDKKTSNEVLELVLKHDVHLEPSPKAVRRLLANLGEKQLLRLLEIRRADIMSQAETEREDRLKVCDKVFSVLQEILRQKNCLSCNDLAVNGMDIMSFGVPEGKDVGRIKQQLLQLVIDGDLKNDRQILMDWLTKTLKP